MKKHRKPMLAVLCFMTVLLLCGRPSLHTQAAASDMNYQGIYLGAQVFGSSVGPKVKVGKYYLWMELIEGGFGKRLKVAKSKTSKGTTIASKPKKGDIHPNIASNGKKVYYVSNDEAKGNFKLVQVDLATQKSKVVETISRKKDNVREGVQHVYGRYVYYRDSAFSVVRFDTKTKKKKAIASISVICAAKGRYMYIERWVNGSQDILVYDCEKDKLHLLIKKKITEIENYCDNIFYYHNDKIYITQYDNGTKYFTIYRYNLSGSGKKVIKKKKSDCYMSGYFKGDYYYYEEENYQRINLKTKKVQKISQAQYEKGLI